MGCATIIPMLLNHMGKGVWDWRQGDVSLCPECHEQLIAKRGNIVVWHWAHRRKSNCIGSEGETDWHMAMKLAHLACGWRIEYPCEIGGRRLRLDAYNEQTAEVREFVHSLCPAYVEKNQVLASCFRQALWIFDGQAFTRKNTESEFLSGDFYDEPWYFGLLTAVGYQGIKSPVRWKDHDASWGAPPEHHEMDARERYLFHVTATHRFVHETGEWRALASGYDLQVVHYVYSQEDIDRMMEWSGWNGCGTPPIGITCQATPRSHSVYGEDNGEICHPHTQQPRNHYEAMLKPAADKMICDLGRKACILHVPRGFFGYAQGEGWVLLRRWSGFAAAYRKTYSRFKERCGKAE